MSPVERQVLWTQAWCGMDAGRWSCQGKINSVQGTVTERGVWELRAILYDL